MTAPQTRLLAIDWGTSAVRLYSMDERGSIQSQRSAPLGVARIVDGNFGAALTELCGGAVPPQVPMIACGMIGSRQGWIEAPYLECPANFSALATTLSHVPGMRLMIVPGLICHDGVPDVIRGEETQIVGAVDEDSDSPTVVVLPGTHSKWALVEQARIDTFATFMTGELYAVLREHSILGRLIGPKDSQQAATSEDSDAFARGVRYSLRAPAALSRDIFSARTLALTKELAPSGVDDYLSGLLIGAEIAAGRDWLRTKYPLLDERSRPLILLGAAALAQKYLRALTLANIDATIGPDDAAARGLWRIALEAGLVR